MIKRFVIFLLFIMFVSGMILNVYGFDYEICIGMILVPIMVFMFLACLIKKYE